MQPNLLIGSRALRPYVSPAYYFPCLFCCCWRKSATLHQPKTAQVDQMIASGALPKELQAEAGHVGCRSGFRAWGLEFGVRGVHGGGS